MARPDPEGSYWSVPPPENRETEDPNYLAGEGIAEGTTCEEDACSKGYPVGDDEAFSNLMQKRAGPDEKTDWDAFGNEVKALRQKAAIDEPADQIGRAHV